ncbi:helix-turn-helix domain-containing protein [Pseudoduganella sp. FT25W]|uniref:Helix-turn-helix domain-containing protein n=1 Tax=Duganella alba TaxID=2666081 RepID=A0A6L5QJ83_9BURK|nr:helix-turn-helix domain-containing protein [Duganella alba]MRX09799.1 helix-turn-helix domain-containing protein [Duganella alba]MRX17436.1 helix-turn-helix domain-containing protein [Duganella alba]
MSAGYTETVSQRIAARDQRYALPDDGGMATNAAPQMLRQHFTVAGELRSLQAPAWSDYVGRILEVPVTRGQMARGFFGELDTYVFKDLVFLDSRTDPVCQRRTNARISRDAVRDYVFHVAVEGMVETVAGPQQRRVDQFTPGILALDMGQPMQMMRPSRARVLAFFVPRAMVEAEIADAPAIHGRVVGYTTPLGRLILGQVATLCHQLPQLSDAEAAMAIRTCAQLIIAAFGKQARLSAGARAAANAALRSQVQRYIQANLGEETLTPETVLQQFSVPRPTLYRMFEAEGGLGAYIRHCRLREAANELVRAPRVAVTQIAYGLCFSSPSDFIRAFRRVYGMTPQDFRMQSLLRDLGLAGATF